MTWEEYQKAIQDFVVEASGLPDASVVWMQQQKPRPPAPANSSAIMLRITNISEIGLPEETTQDNPLTFDDMTVTAVDVGGNALTIPAHGRGSGDGPVLVDSTTNDPPAPLVEEKKYWIIALDANRIRFADTFEKTGGGHPDNPVTPVVLTDAGTGTLTVKATDETMKAGQELLAVARTQVRVTVELECHSDKGVGSTMATSVLQRVKTRRVLPSVRQILQDANMTLNSIANIRAFQGRKDALLFEPRAYLDIHFDFGISEAEAITIIRSVELTDESVEPNQTVTVTAE